MDIAEAAQTLPAKLEPREEHFRIPSRMTACACSCAICRQHRAQSARARSCCSSMAATFGSALSIAHQVRRPLVARRAVRLGLRDHGASTSTASAPPIPIRDGRSRRAPCAARSRCRREPPARAGGAFHLPPSRRGAAVVGRAFLGHDRRRRSGRPLSRVDRSAGAVRPDRATAAASRADAPAGLALDLAEGPVGTASSASSPPASRRC